MSKPIIKISNEKFLRLFIASKTPLLMHNDRTKDPLDIYTKVMKPLTSKKKKTDADHEALARIEWESGLYLFDGEIKLEADMLEACFRNGCKRNKNGEKFKSGVRIVEHYLPLSYDGPKIMGIPEIKATEKNGSLIPIPELDKFFPSFMDRRSVNVQRNSIMRTRPKFENWSLECTLQINADVINEESVLLGCTEGGAFVGICERNISHFGLFTVEVIEKTL